MKNWNVIVEAVGCIGSVTEDTEELARSAALSKYNKEGSRVSDEKYIRDDDEFFVVRK